MRHQNCNSLLRFTVTVSPVFFKHTAAKKIIHCCNGDEDAAWDLLMDDPNEGKYWRAKYAFQIQKETIEDTTAGAGITVDEYMRFFHPDRTEY